MATTLNAGTATGGAAISADTTGVLALQSGSTPTTAVTIDTAQNVGIGTGSPSRKLTVYATGSSVPAVITNDQTQARLCFKDSVTSLDYTVGIGSIGENLALYTGGTERMRIDSSGNLLVNGTSSAASTARIQVYSTAGNGNTGYIASLAGGSGASNANQQVGYMVGQTNCLVYAAWDGSGNARNSVYVQAVSQGVQLSSGGTSWSAISDIRQKDIIEPITDAANKVSTLRAVIGKYKNDEENIRRSFLIAQDVQAVLPEAITIEDKGQDTEKLLLSYTDTIPLLVAAIQELNAKVDAQAAEIKALKGVA